MNIRQILFVPLILIFCNFSAFAEDFNYKGELFSGGSLSFFSDSEGLEPHYTVGSFDFGAGTRPSERFGVEFSGRRVYADNNRLSYPFKSTLWILGGNVLYHFSSLKVQPYVFAGGAILNYHRISGAPSLPEDFISDETSFGLNTGVGLRAFLRRNISLRPQFSLLYDTKLDQHNERHSYLINFSASVAVNF